LEQFEQQFKVHTWKWLHVKTIPIIIAGDPSIAKAYICWIFNNDTNFLTKEITLKHHFMGREQIKVKVNEFMHGLFHTTLMKNVRICNLMVMFKALKDTVINLLVTPKTSFGMPSLLVQLISNELRILSKRLGFLGYACR
jgi:hypothetical protein